jgi:hypothetical protein
MLAADCPDTGETIKFLRDIKKKYGRQFEDRVNVDLHSCGGWSVESWVSEVSFHFDLRPALANPLLVRLSQRITRTSTPLPR